MYLEKYAFIRNIAHNNIQLYTNTYTYTEICATTVHTNIYNHIQQQIHTLNIFIYIYVNRSSAMAQR